MTVTDAVIRMSGVRATSRLLRRAREGAGGSIRFRVIFLFAAVEALANADTGTVGSVAPQLEHSLHVTTGEIGIIAAVAAAAGAVGTIPAGMLTDRFNRIRLLSLSIILWCAAQVGGALSGSFLMLVLTRVGLGAVTATAGPTIASLTGDYFPTRERARIWGLILTGELVGAGLGVGVSGNLASVLSWRYGFAWLAAPGILLAAGIWFLLVEPARGGRTRLQPGATDFVPDPPHQTESVGVGDDLLQEEQELAQDVVRKHHESPHPDLVLHEDPVRMSVWRAVRYVLRVRTNVVLILANALGYLFFAGVQTFAVVLLRSRYGLSEGASTSMLLIIGIGALIGVVGAGQLADRLLAGGRESARVVVPAVCYIAAAILFLPGLLSATLFISMPLFVIAGGFLAAPDPPLNAARLDIMHPRLWGRAEGVRTFLYMSAFAVGPLFFGFISQALGGPTAGAANRGHVKQTSAMAYAFLIMLVPLAVSGITLLRARRTYPRDVATAAASLEATRNHAEEPERG
ncbi:MAG TPA: MFS transporter [Solirubrobacteraceae bacterium]|nr:MFS transporter [Solirubrobacteraceae bacterium]